ncbi:petrobactin biosynthesis protein AsbD [Metabacillus fastidiosus]|uniref:petrobactin biosynthesis protein AsbD n=1 Tax=Metabacillus fastidiosus TaxID=1458 RepID=UPI003D276170
MTRREERMKQLETIMKQKLEITGLDVLQESMRLLDDLSIDSIMILQLIVCIEEDMNLVVPAEKLNPSVFKTVGSLVDFIEELEQKGGEV